MDSAFKEPEKMTKSFFGLRRTFRDLNLQEILFLAIGTASLLACLGLSIERLDYLSPSKCPYNRSKNATVLIEDEKKCGADFTFALLILVNCVFCLFHVIHGVVWERPYELYIFAGSILVVTCYCVMDFVLSIEHGLNPDGYPYAIKLARLVILLSLGSVDVVLGCWIAFRFLREGRFACNLVRTYDSVIQFKCKVHFFTQSLLTFDLEFQVTLVVLILRNGFEWSVLSNEELGILITGLIFTGIWIVTAFIALRLESRPLAWFILLSSVLEPAYIIYKMVDSAMLISAADSVNLSLHYAVFLGGSLGILIRIILVISMYMTSRSFGEHLNDRIYGNIPKPIFETFGRKTANEESSVN